MVANLFTLPDPLPSTEQFSDLIPNRGVKIERIVSTGQITPENEWYDQDRAEWVVVLKGRAGLRFEDETEDRTLAAGDFVTIAAHRRHRVVWTAAEEPTIWLALYFDPCGRD